MARSPDEKSMGMAAQLIGEERIIWASDYSHFDAEENGVTAGLLSRLGPYRLWERVQPA